MKTVEQEHGMNHDYCVVGPRFVLSTDGNETSAAVLTVRAQHRPGTTRVRLRADCGNDAIRIRRPESDQPLSAGDRAEVLRLFVRTCADFSGYRLPLEIDPEAAADVFVQDALRVDGFSKNSAEVWRRPAGVFTRAGAKARTMEDVYQDLLSVPWNFVPREWDVIGPLIDDAGLGSRTVLDLGCGVGKNVQPLTRRGFAVHGVDPSPTAIRRCRAALDDESHPERFVVGTGSSLPWRDASFDRVLDVGALHCMPEDERRLAVAEIARVLKPGALLYSRFFKPRPRSWLHLQPMVVERFGLTVEEVRDLLGAELQLESLTETGPAIYVKASRPNLR